MGVRERPHTLDSALIHQITALGSSREKKRLTATQGERNVEAGSASVAGLSRGVVGRAFTTMLFRSRHHFDVAVRSEAYDHGACIPNGKEKPDQGNGYRGFLHHASTHFHVSDYYYQLIDAGQKQEGSPSQNQFISSSTTWSVHPTGMGSRSSWDLSKSTSNNSHRNLSTVAASEVATFTS